MNFWCYFWFVYLVSAWTGKSLQLNSCCTFFLLHLNEEKKLSIRWRKCLLDAQTVSHGSINWKRNGSMNMCPMGLAWMVQINYACAPMKVSYKSEWMSKYAHHMYAGITSSLPKQINGLYNWIETNISQDGTRHTFRNHVALQTSFIILIFSPFKLFIWFCFVYHTENMSRVQGK